MEWDNYKNVRQKNLVSRNPTDPPLLASSLNILGSEIFFSFCLPKKHIETFPETRVHVGLLLAGLLLAPIFNNTYKVQPKLSL